MGSTPIPALEGKKMRTPEEQQKLHDEYVAKQDARNKLVMEEAAKILLFASNATTQEEMIDELRERLGVDVVDEAIDDLAVDWTLDWIAGHGMPIMKNG